MQHIFKFSTLIILFSLFFTACSTHKQPEKLTSETIKKMIGAKMYVKKDAPPFAQGERVTVLSIDGSMAMTDKGEISLSNLEEQRSTFRITIRTSASAKVRILNIVPIYSDGMWLPAGKYHIEVSEPGYKTYKKWTVLDSDKKLDIQLEKSAVLANGTITWQKEKNIFSANGFIWQYREDDAEKMTWMAAKEYCANLETVLFGYRTQDFTLPNDAELLALFNATPTIEYKNPIYWSSTIDETQDSYAKYVNINSGENSWYKKYGKTYVMCRQEIPNTDHLSLEQLALALADSETAQEFSLTLIENEQSVNQHALNALQMAIFLKYGRPMIRNPRYRADIGIMIFELVSQKHDQNGEPLYRKEVTLEVEKKDAKAMRAQLMDPAFEPFVEFKVTDGQLRFIGI